MTTLYATFDGQVLLPEEPIPLPPSSEYASTSPLGACGNRASSRGCPLIPDCRSVLESRRPTGLVGAVRRVSIRPQRGSVELVIIEEQITCVHRKDGGRHFADWDMPPPMSISPRSPRRRATSEVPSTKTSHLSPVSPGCVYMRSTPPARRNWCLASFRDREGCVQRLLGR
jgi:hypothetical protein